MTASATPRPLGLARSVAIAVAAAVAISTVYLPQALVGPIAADLGIPLSAAGLIATITQLGYALGIILLVPLGDIIRPRRLVTVLFAITGLALVGAAFAPSFGVLAMAFAVGGLACVIPAILIPLAGAMSTPATIGRTVAAVGTGIGVGIFGSRIAAGAIAQAWDWRAVPVVFAVLGVASCAVVVRVLPRRHANPVAGYLATLRRLPRIFARSRVLREAMWMQFWIFSSMNALWTVVAVHLTTRLGWSLAQAGAFALVGLVATVCTPLAGRFIDTRGARAVLTVGVITAAAAVVILGFLPVVPAALVSGFFALTLVAQGSQVAQQARIFAESPRDRSAVNTIFTGSIFAGGAVGAAVGVPVYLAAGMPGLAGVVGVCVLLSALGLVRTSRAGATNPRTA